MSRAFARAADDADAMAGAGLDARCSVCEEALEPGRGRLRLGDDLMHVRCASEGIDALERFEVAQERAAGVARVALHGELDLATADAVEAAVDAAFEERPKRLVLDLSKLTFLGSTGLSLLMRTDACARHNDVELVLIPAAASVQRVIELAGLLDLLPWITVGPELPAGA